ncbi:MAG: hypothetical protein PVG78_06605 [Desulfobacterales bacterium]|jgi:hypothetical protein
MKIGENPSVPAVSERNKPFLTESDGGLHCSTPGVLGSGRQNLIQASGPYPEMTDTAAVDPYR